MSGACARPGWPKAPRPAAESTDAGSRVRAGASGATSTRPGGGDDGRINPLKLLTIAPGTALAARERAWQTLIRAPSRTPGRGELMSLLRKGLVAGVVLALAATSATAQPYPSQAITITVAAAAGGFADG